MKLVDANVLLYAVNRQSRHHDASRTWLEVSLSGGATVGFAWVVLLAFVRVSTRSGVFPQPLPVATALEVVADWLAQASALVVAPTSRHPALLRDLLAEVGSGGNLVNDAHLAALALEHRAEIVTYDTDFARFPGVRWSRPPE